MKKIISISFALFLLINAHAQVAREWSTYVGGTGDEGISANDGTVTDKFGNVYLASTTTSTSSIASGGFQNTHGGGLYDAFLVKFDSIGNLLWSTYYGSTGDDRASAVTVDSSGNVYLTGYSNSTSGIASGGYQNVFGGGTFDAFIVKFNAAGSRLWATYYGGTAQDLGMGICTDITGNVYLAGGTQSTSSIASGGFQLTYGGGANDAYLAKFDATGNLIWSTYYGGTDYDRGSKPACDALGNVYLTGYANSTAGISSGGFQNIHGGSSDAFLVKFSSAGARLWATYYGGCCVEEGTDVAIDNSNNIYLCGYTSSPGFILAGGFQSTIGGGQDNFLVKFDASGNHIWGTYYGNTGSEGTAYCAVSYDGHVYLAGATSSTTAIASGGFQNTIGGGQDAYLVKFDASGARIAATYYGGTLNDSDWGIATDQHGNIYMSGYTESTSGISFSGYQNTFGGGTSDNFLLKFSSCNTSPALPGSIAGITTLCAGTTNTYSISPVAGASSYTWTLPSGWSGTSTTNTINATANTTSGNISVVANNACGSTSASTLTITVNTIPTTPSSIAGSVSICEGSSNTYSVTAISGATAYAWTLPPGWSGTSTTNTINTTAPANGGTISVIAANACGTSAPANLNITVNLLPTVSVNLAVDTLCVSAPLVILSGGTPTGGTFSGTGVTSGSFNPSTTGTGNFTITYTFTDANACTNSATDNIVVDACLSNHEMDDPAQIQIYPSPTNGPLNLILSTSTTNATIRIYNAMGQIIYTAQTIMAKNQLDLSVIDPGVYFVQINNANKYYIKKFVKTN